MEGREEGRKEGWRWEGGEEHKGEGGRKEIPSKCTSIFSAAFY